MNSTTAPTGTTQELAAMLASAERTVRLAEVGYSSLVPTAPLAVKVQRRARLLAADDELAAVRELVAE